MLTIASLVMASNLLSKGGHHHVSFHKQSYILMQASQNYGIATLYLAVFSPSSSGFAGVTGPLTVGASAMSKNGTGLDEVSSFGGTWGVLAVIPGGASKSAPTIQGGGYFTFEETTTATASAYAAQQFPLGLWVGNGTGYARSDLGTSASYSSPPTGSAPPSYGGPTTEYGYTNGDIFAMNINGDWQAAMPSNENILLGASTSSGSTYPDGASASASSSVVAGSLAGEMMIILY